MQFDRGYVSPYMVTDTEKMEAVIDDAYILITDKKISNIQEILPLLEQIVQAGKKLVIIAEDVEGEALATILSSTSCAAPSPACASRPPASATAARRCMQDIAVLTGGQVISDELGMELKDATFDMLGRARQVKVDQGEHHHRRRRRHEAKPSTTVSAQIKNQYRSYHLRLRP